MLWRGITKRGPVCGGGRLFTGWFRMKERRPMCGYRFEREEGFFLFLFYLLSRTIWVAFELMLWPGGHKRAERHALAQRADQLVGGGCVLG